MRINDKRARQPEPKTRPCHVCDKPVRVGPDPITQLPLCSKECADELEGNDGD